MEGSGRLRPGGASGHPISPPGPSTSDAELMDAELWTPEQLQALESKVLRCLLSSPSPLIHSQLRETVLGSSTEAASNK